MKFVNTTFQSQISLASFSISPCSLHHLKPQTFFSHNTKNILPIEGPTLSYYPLSSAALPLTDKTHSRSWLTSGENKSCHLIGYFCSHRCLKISVLIFSKSNQSDDSFIFNEFRQRKLFMEIYKKLDATCPPPPVGTRGLNRECAHRVPLRVVKGD